MGDLTRKKDSCPRLMSKTSIWFCYLMAFSAFIKLSPYFTWDSFGNSNIVAIFFNFCIPALACIFGFLTISLSKIRYQRLASALFIFIFGLAVVLAGNNNLSSAISTITQYTLLFIFILQTDNEQSSSYQLYYRIFAFSLMPGVIIYILLLLGLNLPYDTIQPTNLLKLTYGHVYRHYFASVVYTTNTTSAFCGMFDEPGLVGTFCGLFLVSNNLINSFRVNKKRLKWYDFVMLIAGILSNSKAFYIILIVAIILRLIFIKNTKGLLGLLVVIALIVIIINIKTDIEIINYLQNSVKAFTEFGTVQLGRTNVGFDEAFQGFLNNDFINVLFGNGYMSSQLVTAFAGSAEIRMLVYDIGFVGTLMLIIWIVMSIKQIYYYRKKMMVAALILIITFVLSIYQRQYITTIDYIVLLFGGSAYIKLNYNNMNNGYEYKFEK